MIHGWDSMNVNHQLCALTYTILYNGLEHLWVLVSIRDTKCSFGGVKNYSRFSTVRRDGAQNLYTSQGSTVLCISSIVPICDYISMLLLEDFNFVCLTF